MLSATTFLHTLGTGLSVTLGAVYFTQVVNLPVKQVGVGLTIAGLVGMLAAIPFGRWSDRVGPKPLLIALLTLQGCAVGAHALVDSHLTFLIAVTFLACANQGASAVRSALIAEVVPETERTVVRAYLRAITNVGFGLGTAVAAIALAGTNRNAYELLFLLAAALFFAAAATMTRAPVTVSRTPAELQSRWLALTDGPYISVVVMNAAMNLHYAILEVGIPLWIVRHTDAPRPLVSVLLIANTVIIVGFQVAVGRRWGALADAGRLFALAGTFVATACVLIGLSGSTSGLPTVLLLVIGAAVHAAGEICHTTASWAAGFGLAPDDAQGQYQGVFTTGTAGSQMLGPALVVLVVLSNGLLGWLLAAALFFVVGVIAPSLVVWAASRRPAVAVGGTFNR